MMLFRNRQATMALCMLRCCAPAKGYAPHLYRRCRYHPGYEWTTLESMRSKGLVVLLRSGPRGGKRYHTTELGQAVLDVVAQHGRKSKPILTLLPGFAA